MYKSITGLLMGHNDDIKKGLEQMDDNVMQPTSYPPPASTGWWWKEMMLG